MSNRSSRDSQFNVTGQPVGYRRNNEYQPPAWKADGHEQQAQSQATGHNQPSQVGVDIHTQPVPTQVEVDNQRLPLQADSQLVYRQAVLDDAVELHQVIVDAYEPLRQLQIPFPAGYATVEIIENNIATHECYVLLRDGQIAATVTLDRDDQPRLKALSDLPFIRWFAVAPRFKGQGDGARLLDWVEQQIILGKHHQPGVMLATASRHPWLATMYERKGYRIFHDYVNQGEHIVYMAKQLNQEVDFKSLLHV